MPRYSMIGSLSLALMLLLGTSAYAAGAYAAGRCEAVVKDRIAQANVDEADVRKVSYMDQRRAGRSGLVVGVDAWVSFHSCKGSVVIKMNKQCDVKEVYTRGNCQFPGFSNN